MNKPSKVKLVIILYKMFSLYGHVSTITKFVGDENFEVRYLRFLPIAKSRNIEIDKKVIQVLSFQEVALFLEGWQSDKRLRYIHELCKKIGIRVYYKLDDIPPF